MGKRVCVKVPIGGFSTSRKDDKVFSLLVLVDRWWIGFGGQIFPGWVGGFDESDLFLTGEVFQVFLACDGVLDVLESLKVDETVGFVS
jgi:hypothetical protein